MPHGKQWFFGVGISEYVELAKLSNAVKDVKDISEMLIEDYGLLPEHAVTLFNEQATRDNIIDELDALVEKVGKDDSLLIYFAGHGHMKAKTQRGFWIPSDAEINSTSKYIRNSTIRDYLKDIRSKHTLLIADSCFSGSLFVRDVSRSSAALHEMEAIPSRWAICSGRHDEPVSDGFPGKNSPFAQSILDTLRDNKRPLFNVSRLVERVVEQTRSNYKQLPEGNPVQNTGHKGGQYIFHLKAREEKFWEECQRNNTISGYSQYLGQFREGKYRSEALSQIKELEDEKAYRIAERSGTVSALHIYVGGCPDGKYVEEARKKISILERLENDFAADERRKVEEKILPPLDHLSDKEQFETPSREEKEDVKNGPEEQLGESSQKEENSYHFVEFKKSSLFSLTISIVFYVLVGFMVYLLLSGVVTTGVFWIVFVLGYVIYQLMGIAFSIRSYHVGFKEGTHAGYLLPILTVLVWWVGLVFTDVNFNEIFMLFASIGPMIISILGRRYIVIAAKKKWRSVEDS